MIGLGGKILFTGMLSVMAYAILTYIDENLTNYYGSLVLTRRILIWGGVIAFFVGGLLEVWL